MSELETFWSALEGHRRLTVRTVEAFPEERLFGFKPAEPMRPFALIAGEILSLEEMIVRGVATGEWALWDENSKYLHLKSKAEIVDAFHEVRNTSRLLWPTITPERWHAVEPDLWGQAPSSMQSRLGYMLDNEIHHRGQGYVYLRLLGIEPPAFWER